MIDTRTFAPSSVRALAARVVARLGAATRSRAPTAPAFAGGSTAARPGVWGLLVGELHDRSR